MKNPRTTIAGVMTILGALVTFGAGWIGTGQAPGAEAWALLGGALTVGAGLITAADGKPPQ
jgi:hypothetical protein